MGESVIKEKSRSFALSVIKLYQTLCQENKEFVLSKQLLRSGTSIGANVVEAHHAMSKKEFSAKMNIALKEAAETEYWLDLLYHAGYIGLAQFTAYQQNCTELLRILTSIIKTAKKE